MQSVNRRPVLAAPIALGHFDGKFAAEITGLQLENPSDLAVAISPFADKRMGSLVMFDRCGLRLCHAALHHAVV